MTDQKNSPPLCPECKSESIGSQKRPIQGFVLVYCTKCGHIIACVPDVSSVKVKKSPH